MSGAPELEHKHRFRKFHCLESSEDPFPRTLLICFGCRRAYVEEKVYREVPLRIA